MIKIIKRNGTNVEFDVEKIKNAIRKASAATETQEISEHEINEISEYIEFKVNKSDKLVTVENIQDIVEHQLMALGYFDIAINYIQYRFMHNLARNDYNTLMDAVSKKLNAENIENQNANVDEHSFGGRVGEATNLVTKEYAFKYCISEKTRKNHEDNIVYIHDASSYATGSHNCITIPFDPLLAKGFNTRQTDVRPAQSVGTAMQLIAVVFQLQSLQQFGGVSASHLDHTMVPYVRKSFFKRYLLEYLKTKPEFDTLDILNLSEEELDNWVSENKNKYLKEMNLKEEDFYFESNKLNSRLKQIALFETRRETYQAVEGMFHNLNTLQSRSGNQLPFTSINFGTCTLPEGRLITKAILETSIKGLGKLHKTSIFPCSIFQCMKGVNRKPGDPNYDLFLLALQSTAKRLYPNYANVDWSGNAGYDRDDPRTYFSTMGCRTANGWDINGFGQLKDGRGNICPTTIIMPTLAMMAKENYVSGYDDSVVELFMYYLDQKIHEAKDSLIERYKWICKQPASSAKFMYENNVMAGYVPEEGIESALKHGTLAIGQLGLAETLQILIGKNHTTPEGMELAKRIEQLFKDRCAEFKEEYKLNFGVYYTPAENLCYTAMKKFKEKYGEIPNVSDRDYFTNSIHVPVWEVMDPFTKIDIESQLTGYSSAGCITYIELESAATQNIPALETIVNYAMDKDIPYFAINVPNDVCLDCGFTGEFEVCPECNSSHRQQIRRVTGYLTGDYKTAFNYGKQKEVEDRYQHSRSLRNNLTRNFE